MYIILITLRMLISGLAGIVIVEIYSAIMQMKFQNTNNHVGKAFAVLGIYLYAVIYCKNPLPIHSQYQRSETNLTITDGMINSTTWTYGAEVLPIALRSKVMGLGALAHFVVNVGITEAGPTAFAKIKQNYYYVFVACSFFFLVMAYFFFPETKQKSLEEIAAAFGDKVVAPDENNLKTEEAIFKGKTNADHEEEIEVGKDVA